MKKIVVALVAVMALFGTVACDTDEAKVNDEVVAGENTDAGNTQEGGTDAADEEQTLPVFGEQVSYDDGLAVTVSAPKPFKPGQYAAGGKKGDQFVEFTITVVNGTKKPYDPVDFYQTLQSGNAEAEEVYDSENGFNGTPSTTVLPGREAEWKVGYAVKDPNSLVMEINVDFEFERDSILYVASN